MKQTLQRGLLVLLIVLSICTGCQPAKKKDGVLFAPPAMINNEVTFRLFPPLDINNSLREWETFFNEVDQYDNVTIILNGPGGWLVVLDYVRERIKNSPANIKVIVTQGVASADAMAICEFQDVHISPYAYVIFHMVANGDTLEKHDDQFNTCVSKGWITKEELKKMNEGFEVWVTYDKQDKRHVEFIRDSRLPAEGDKAWTHSQ